MSKLVISPQSFTQNGQTWTFEQTKIIKGQTQGNPVLRAKPEFLTPENVIQWYGGMDEVQKILVRGIHRDEAAASNEAYNEQTDTFDVSKWSEAMAGGGASATQAELEDEIEQIGKDSLALVTGDNPKFSPFDGNNPEHRAEAMRLKGERARIQTLLDIKAESNRKRVEARKANAEAKAGEGQTTGVAAVAA